jgi:hypothetical protein
MQDFFRTFYDSRSTYLENFMLGHEWVDEIYIYNYRLHTNCFWSLGLKVAVSYIGYSTLIRRQKGKHGRHIY